MNIYIQIILVVFALALSLYLLKRNVNVGLVMVIGAIFVAVIARIPFWDALKYGYQGVKAEKTIQLILTLFLIMMLENIMRNTGKIKTIVDSLKELVRSNRLAAAFLPMVLGLLPSPGGARFSCPMVEGVIKEDSSNENKAFINYWFRHIWMDGFILYPGIILAAGFVNVSVINMFYRIIPFMLINFIIGAIMSFKYVKKEIINVTYSSYENSKKLFLGLLPIILVIILYIIMLPYTHYSMEISCTLVLIVLIIVNKYNIKSILKMAKEAFPIKLVLIIVGAMIFKEVLLNSGAMDEIPALMDKYSIPGYAVFIILPFIAGLSSGITVSYVSMTFPIMLPLGLSNNLWMAALAFGAGFAGVMVSPLHLCSVMTAEYFDVPLMRLLKKVGIGQVFLFAIIFCFIYIIAL